MQNVILYKCMMIELASLSSISDEGTTPQLMNHVNANRLAFVGRALSKKTSGRLFFRKVLKISPFLHFGSTSDALRKKKTCRVRF